MHFPCFESRFFFENWGFLHSIDPGLYFLLVCVFLIQRSRRKKPIKFKLISLGWRFETLQKKSQNRGHEETFQKKSTFIPRMKNSLYFDDFCIELSIDFLILRDPGFFELFWSVLDPQPREINLNLIGFFLRLRWIKNTQSNKK